MTRPSPGDPTEPDRSRRSLPTAVVDGWRTFWFSPQSTYSLGAVRIGFGVLAVAWTASLLPDLYSMFGREGVAPHEPTSPYRWSLFEAWSSDRALLIGWIVLLVAAAAMTIGWHSRLASLTVLVMILSFQFRDPGVFNSGDVLVRIEALFLALSPCGAALSLDQRRRVGSFFSAQIRPQWPIRLLQVQLSLIYLSTVAVKMRGDAWPRGTAVSYALRLHDMLIIQAPHWFTNNALLINVATWGTLVLELALGTLVWSRRIRPWVLGAGVVMHSTIIVTMGVGFFTPAIFVLYLAFVSPEPIERFITRRQNATPETSELAEAQHAEPPGEKLAPVGVQSHT